MSDPLDENRQLLYGLLALQNQFVERTELITALRVWLIDRSRPLADIFEKWGAIPESARPLLDALVAHQFARLGNELEKNLGAIDPDGILQGLASEPGLRASLAEFLDGKTTEPEDPFATKNPSFVPETTPSTDLTSSLAITTSRRGPIGPSEPGLSRFRVLRPHAKGGLGQVSVALDAELGRLVALKEIQEHHADHPEYRSRFIREAEITGKLEHPGIIPVYGLGRDPLGRPYYAMRFIRGDNLDAAITRYHQSILEGASEGDRTLQLRELLGRFLDVCNAIAYAHSRRVIHRDLKPGNILLGPFGETLVVDWGLAKPLDDLAHQDDDGSTLGPIHTLLEGSGSTPTMAGTAHGTPAYMSPEQAEGRLDQLGPRSDVYSLGATLYHVLTGRPPFGGADALRRVSLGDFPHPRKIREGVPEALEAICLKAMATKVEDRYESPESLAVDLKLWLADEPVSAWREPFSVRGGRWMKRHRTAVTAGAAGLLVAIVALGAIGITLAGKNRQLLISERKADLARNQAERALKLEEQAKAEAEESARAESLAKVVAEAASKKAEIEARTAERTKEFLVDIFVDADPLAVFTGRVAGSQTRRETQSAVEILERGAKKIVTELKDEPLVQASLMESIGNALRSKAEIGKADPLLRQSLAIRQSHLPSDDLAIADSLENLGWLLQDQGKTADALILFQETLAIRRPKLGDDHPLVARVLFHMAWAFAEDGRTSEAEPLFRKVLAFREAHPADLRALNITRLGMAGMLVDSGRNLEAFPLILSALKSLFSEEGMEEAIKAVSLFQIGVIASQNRRTHPFAERSLRESLAISSKLLGEDHPYNAFAVFTLATLFAEEGRLDEAEALYRRCVNTCREKAGMGYPRVVRVVSEFALFLDRRGKTEEAIALYDEMIQARRLRFAANHVMIAEGLAFQGGFLRVREPQHGEAILREALDIFGKHPEFRSARRVECHEMLGEMLFNRGDYPQAELHFRSALDLLAILPSSDFIDQGDSKAWDLGKLGTSILHQGRLSESEARLLESIQLYRTLPGPPNQRGLYFPLDALAFLRLAQGRPLDAAELTSERRRACEGKPFLLYKVASDLALYLGKINTRTADQAALRETMKDQAIEILNQSVRAGFRDGRKLRSDPTLQPLLDRKEFRDLTDDLGFPTNPFRPLR